MNRKYILTILAISVIAVLTYFLLGGFNSTKYDIVENPRIYIFGTYYEGTLGSDSLRDLFVTARQIVSNNDELEAIAIAYYGDVNQENGFVRNFIGVKVSDTTMDTNFPNWSFKGYTSNSSIIGCVEANVLAMPTPDDLLLGLRTYAADKNIETDSIFIEYYAGPNNLCVELLSR